MRTFGLIGKSLMHSFSVEYFNKKFVTESITNTQYLNLELHNISEFNQIIQKKQFSGLNVTTPYKSSIIPLLDELSEEAKIIGAVNTIRFSNGRLIGHNTDHIGFRKSIQPLLKGRDKAIILGNGGAAKAIIYTLNKLDIEYKIVNRKTSFDYSDITHKTTDYYTIIINTTPLGTFPKIKKFPNIPYRYLNENHLLFDVIYNPNETKFLAYGRARNAKIKNGREMLEIQAEESWKIWNL